MFQEIKGVEVMKKIMTLLLAGTLFFGISISTAYATENSDYHTTGKVGFFGEYDGSTDSSNESTIDTSESGDTTNSSNQPGHPEQSDESEASGGGSGIAKYPQTGEQVTKSYLLMGIGIVAVVFFLFLWRRKKDDNDDKEQ